MKGVVLSAAVLLAVAAATVVCALKRKFWFAAYGLATSIPVGLLVAHLISVRGDDLADLYLAFFLFVIAPFATPVIIGAAGVAKPQSWWARRFPQAPSVVGVSVASDHGGPDDGQLGPVG